MTDRRTTIICKVTPKAQKSECLGWGVDDQGRRILLLKLAAPPVDGEANKELIRFLAGLIKCSRSDIQILRGASSRMKSVSLTADALMQLESLIQAGG